MMPTQFYELHRGRLKQSSGWSPSGGIVYDVFIVAEQISMKIICTSLLGGLLGWLLMQYSAAMKNVGGGRGVADVAGNIPLGGNSPQLSQ